MVSQLRSYIVIIVLVAAMVMFSLQLKGLSKEAFICMNDPFHYSSKKLSEDTQMRVSCSCSMVNGSEFEHFSWEYPESSEFLVNLTLPS